MQILGLDGGMTRLGVGAVNTIPDGLDLILHGLIYHPRAADQKFNEHLNAGIGGITTDFPRLLNVAQPDLIVSELIPAGKLGANDSLVIAAITTCKVIAFQFGIEWKDIAAVTVKKQLTGNYRATKTQIRNTIFELFPTVETRHVELKKEQKENGEKVVGLPFDVTDALAVAVVGARLYEETTVQEVQEAEA
jgi:Holliday junction resolvasome RuvABC endonuclease subunit